VTVARTGHSQPSRVPRPVPRPGASGSDPIDIDVVVVTFNNAHHITDCLSSIRAQHFVAPHFYLQDNGSSDHTVRVLKAEEDRHPDSVHFTVDLTNPGFARAVNRQIAAGHSPYLLVLNPDTQAAQRSHPDLLHRLVQLADRPGIGFVSPLLIRPNGEVDRACARREPTLLRAASTLAERRFGLVAAGRLGYNIDVADRPLPVEVDAVNGAFMLIRRDRLEAIGPLDERYWMYGEDLDWCRTAREVGLANVCDPEAVWIHAKGGSEPNGRGPTTSRAFRHSMAEYFAKYHGGAHWAPLRVLVRLASQMART
jgi:GT2 family glycosyltransferase